VAGHFEVKTVARPTPLPHYFNARLSALRKIVIEILIALTLDAPEL
jgi:hypothetical protein